MKKMNSNSKKRRRRMVMVSSSSSEEDKRVSKRKEDSKSPKKQKDFKSHKSTKVQTMCVKEDLETSHQVKKPVYRLSKTHGEEQNDIKKDKQHTNTKNAAGPSHGEVYSSKAEANSSGKHKTVGENKTVQAESSKTLNAKDNHKRKASKSKDEDKQETNEKTSKVLADKCFSVRGPSIAKKRRMSPTVGSTEQGNQRHHVEKKAKSSRTEADSSITKDQDPSSTGCEDSAHPKTKLPENTSKIHQEKELTTDTSLSTAPLKISPTFTQNSFKTVNLTTTESSSGVWSNLPESPVSDASVSPQISESLSDKRLRLSQKFVPFKFKIPKQVRPHFQQSKDHSKGAVLKTEPSDSKVILTKVKQVDTLPEHSSLDDTPNSQIEEQENGSASADKLPAANEDNTEHMYDQCVLQSQVVEELHLARSDKRLELNVTESYGELTCMDIDVPEEASSTILSPQPLQQVLVLVLDTNILLSHLEYVKKITSHGLGALGFPIVLIPWVVLQELDYLKKGRGLSGSVAHLATPAISYIYTSLKRRDPRLWGQSMQQAAQSCNGLNAENNDDRVLQCCLQYQNIYPECALILCTNDKNLSSKALLSGIRALSKSDLEAEVETSRHGLTALQRAQAPVMPHKCEQAPLPMSRRSCTQAPPQHQQKTGFPQGFLEEDGTRKESGAGAEDDNAKQRLSECLSDLEKCLRDVLSAVVEKEMKAIYDNIWLQIVCRKPPWTLQDVLQCLKKHWIAVFGHVVPRRHGETVIELIKFFTPGKTPDCQKTSDALQQAKEFVKAFRKRSRHVSQAISEMERISNKLQPQPPLRVLEDSVAGDVVMNEDEVEDKQSTSAQVSHQEVWGIFENIWLHVYQTSLEVFKALSFDPSTMQIVPLERGLTFPQEALTCLHKLASVVLQLLQAFSSILSSAPGLEEVQTLLSVIYSNQIICEDSRLTATVILDCFSQPDYREKLRVGGGQLMELKKALDCCVRASNQHLAFTTQP
ncbi:transcriptional protein SWT1 isoform X2 [Oryzias latipes]|uniref:transcriptional protein SWT1 isoform X2 n=1 Tax=Oryzias latipes TaxID=8090 RepID=UPI0009D9C5FA|nr:transcriptional protein SWT1 isoform X2 [Oryzias latipes]